MTPIRLAQSLARTAVTTAVDTVRHPVAGAAKVVGLARGTVQVARAAPGIVADTVATRTQGGPPSTSPAARTEPAAPKPAAPRPSAKQPAAPAPAPPKSTVPDPADPTAPPAPGQGGVPDLQPPDPADRVLVVEETLAAEQDRPVEEMLGGRTTEPHAASRDEEHGDVHALAPEEIDELEEEAAARE